MKTIKIDEFLSKYNSELIDLVELNFITKDDLKRSLEYENLGTIEKVERLLSYLPFAISHPEFLFSFIVPQSLRGLGLLEQNSPDNLMSNQMIRNNNTKTSLVSCFKPKTIFEIGTYFGWASASFKFTNPDATIYTINPKETKGANNALSEDLIGYFYKEKNLNIEQIWGDSTKFDYSTLPDIDVIYIDGNHDFEYAYVDLQNSASKALKAVILDDYIPPNKARALGIPYGPWNDGVVRSVDKYLAENPHVFRESYTIDDSPYCVLIK